MHDLYSEKDLQKLSGQLKKRFLAIGCILAVILAGWVVSMIIRAEWLSLVSCILCFADKILSRLFENSELLKPCHRKHQHKDYAQCPKINVPDIFCIRVNKKA